MFVSVRNSTADCVNTETGEDVFASLREANTTEFLIKFEDAGVRFGGESILYKYVNDSGCKSTSVGYIILIAVVCIVIIVVAVVIIVLLKRSEAKGRISMK